MSVQKAKEFLLRLTEEPELAARADEEYVRSLARVASGVSPGLSEKELRAALTEVEATRGELGDDDLDKVSGGAHSTTYRGSRYPVDTSL